MLFFMIDILSAVYFGLIITDDSITFKFKYGVHFDNVHTGNTHILLTFR